MLQSMLNAAQCAIALGDTPHALDYLSQARAIARQGNTVSMKAIAAYCVAAMQAIMPDAVGYAMFQLEFSAVRTMLETPQQIADRLLREYFKPKGN